MCVCGVCVRGERQGGRGSAAPSAIRCGALASRDHRLAARRRLAAGCAAARAGRAGAVRPAGRRLRGARREQVQGRLGGPWRRLGDPDSPSVGVRGGEEVLISLICLLFSNR